MPQVSITINGRSYPVACDEGEEDRIRELARVIDSKVAGFARQVGQAGEARLLVLAAQRRHLRRDRFARRPADNVTADQQPHRRSHTPRDCKNEIVEPPRPSAWLNPRGPLTQVGAI